MQWLSDFLFAFIGGFARIFIASFFLWMVGVVGLLFMELFNNAEFVFKAYLQKVWRILILSFQIAGYGSVVVGLILMFMTKEYLTNSLITIDGILLSILYFNLRRRLGSMDGTKKDKQENS
ncbi:hypothetical protein [Shimazuella alba]|uniref:Uncharacterized protein n=1 Tax=Shimazuella alba TaxID=2690964 RepID=A0A6I4VTM4_9BACL|nr:hypothetical protein [Shimazuella alba]MXQ54363.1 hypothetical protein [Shimazuella alba]